MYVCVCVMCMYMGEYLCSWIESINSTSLIFFSSDLETHSNLSKITHDLFCGLKTYPEISVKIQRRHKIDNRLLKKGKKEGLMPPTSSLTADLHPFQSWHSTAHLEAVKSCKEYLNGIRQNTEQDR